MPERPDLDYVVPILQRELTGLHMVRARVKLPVVLRAVGPIEGKIVEISRLAQVVVFRLEHAVLAISPMLAGRFLICEPERKDSADLAVAFGLSDGRELRYRDDVQMGKVYLLSPGQPVPGLEQVGVDVLGPGWTRAHFSALCRSRRDQLKVFLMDKAAIDAMGNAYADEVCWEAQLHPKRSVRKLSADEQERLFLAIPKVIGEAAATIQRRQPPLDEKLRDFLHVRGKAGQPCDRCGTRLRTVGVHGHDAHFCPACQPDTEAKGMVDWRKLSG
jgi:formamidopyrimidine-DNA glycosylase